jgi:hypothetical protein
MHMRVVRFTDVDPQRVREEIRSRVEERGGPPEGVTSTGMKMLLDEEQRTAVVLQYFATEEDMRSSEAALDAMDPSDTPGTRASVDRCEVAVEVEA